VQTLQNHNNFLDWLRFLTSPAEHRSTFKTSSEAGPKRPETTGNRGRSHGGIFGHTVGKLFQIAGQKNSHYLAIFISGRWTLDVFYYNLQCDFSDSSWN